MKRREFLGLGGTALFGGAVARLAAQSQATLMGQMPAQNAATANSGETTTADFTLRIAPVALEIAPSRFISTIGYNGASPGARPSHEGR